MKGIILTSHGQLANGLYDALKMFIDEPEQVETLSLLPGQSMDEFSDDLIEKINNVDTGDGVVIFCDLLFGTPCNVSGKLLGDEEFSNRIKIITGMNFPMVLEFAQSRNNNQNAEDVLNVGKDAIVDFNQLMSSRK